MTEIENVSDTARWVAVYRAMETARPDAIFKDPFAARLAGAKGNDIVDSMQQGRSMAWTMITRTAVFDEIILDRIQHGGADLVLNLAAGLDARPWRMALPPALTWVDVDLPAILGYKTEMLKDEKPVCRYEAVQLDLADEPKRRALFSQLGARSKRALIISEGLLIYLTPEHVGSLAKDLHDQPAFQWWVHDIGSPRLLEYMRKRWGKNLDAGNAPFKFGPAESTKFFEPFGWREASFHPTFEDARRLKRTPRAAWLFRLMGMLGSKKTKEQNRRFAGNALLERI